jgi:hypothetical protein
MASRGPGTTAPISFLPATCGVAVLALAGAVGLQAPAPARAEETAGEWQASGAFALGALAAPEEIGRDTNTTGGEALIARLPEGPMLAVRSGFERGFVYLGGEWASPLLPIEVENDAGVDFPNHGQQPLLYALEAQVFPFGRRRIGGHLRPYAVVGAGGALLSVDLDNRRGQELSHHWLWKAGGGVRWQRSPSAEGLLDLRYDEYHVRGHSPLANFTLRCFALGGTIVRHQRRRSRRER